MIDILVWIVTGWCLIGALVSTWGMALVKPWVWGMTGAEVVLHWLVGVLLWPWVLSMILAGE